MHGVYLLFHSNNTSCKKKIVILTLVFCVVLLPSIKLQASDSLEYLLKFSYQGGQNLISYFEINDGTGNWTKPSSSTLTISDTQNYTDLFRLMLKTKTALYLNISITWDVFKNPSQTKAIGYSLSITTENGSTPYGATASNKIHEFALTIASPPLNATSTIEACRFSIKLDENDYNNASAETFSDTMIISIGTS